MKIPDYTPEEINEKQQLIDEQFSGHSFGAHVAENLVMIEKCLGVIGLRDALSLLKTKWKHDLLTSG